MNGSSRVGAAQRKALFVEAYNRNGGNASAAVREAGYEGNEKTIRVRGSKLLADPAIKSLIETRSREIVAISQLTTENWAREVAAIAHSRVADLYDAAGNLIPIHQLPDHVQAAVASIEGDKVRLHDKIAALGMAARHLGLFEKDNKQRATDLRVIVELVG